MVRSLYLFILFCSCSSGYYLKEGGLRPSNYNEKHYDKFLKNFKIMESSDLEFESLYISENCSNSENYSNSANDQHYCNVYKFYPNGKFSFFYVPFDNIDSLNAKKGFMGFYWFKDKNGLTIFTYLKTSGGAKFYKGNLTINKDTLYRIDGNNDYTKLIKYGSKKNYILIPDW